jgi:hypothetical protein
MQSASVESLWQIDLCRLYAGVPRDDTPHVGLTRLGICQALAMLLNAAN